MIENLTKNVTQHFINNNIISENQREQCEYSLRTRALKLCFMISIFLIAYILGNVMQTAIFLYVVLSLRRRTGGYHAQGELTCLILSITTTVVSVKYIAVILTSMNIINSLLIYLTSIFILLRYAPVNHPNLDMGKKEMEHHRNEMKKLILILSVVLLILGLLNQNSIVALLITGTMLVSISVGISKIIKQEV